MARPQSLAPTVTVRKGTGGRDEREISHPSYATVRVSRVSGRTLLFDSNIEHDGYITLSFHAAKKLEDGYSERVYGELRPVFEVAMSENQFVQMVTRMNIGSGVPCTMRYCRDGAMQAIPEIASFESSAARLGRFADEIDEGVRKQQAERVAQLKALLTKLPQKTQNEVSNLLNLILSQSEENLNYGREVITEHAAKLVTEAKVEISAHVNGICTQLGVDSLHQLTQAAASVHVDTNKLLSDNS